MVTVYSKTNCIQCKMTKRFLDAHDITFKEVQIDAKPEIIDWLKEQGFKSAPVVISDQKTVVGFQPDELKTLAV